MNDTIHPRNRQPRMGEGIVSKTALALHQARHKPATLPLWAILCGRCGYLGPAVDSPELLARECPSCGRKGES